MTRYVVRVELPGHPPADYERLHRNLRAANYFRVIANGKGAWHLPHGEYTCRADGWTAAAIRDEVAQIAAVIHPRPRVLVSECNGTAWTNLRPVNTADPAPDDC